MTKETTYKPGERAAMKRAAKARSLSARVDASRVDVRAHSDMLPVDVLDWAMPRRDRVHHYFRLLAVAEHKQDAEAFEYLSKELEIQLSYLYIETHGDKAFNYMPAPSTVQ